MAKVIVETFCPECKKKMEVEIDMKTERGKVPGLLQYGRYCTECAARNSNEEEDI